MFKFGDAEVMLLTSLLQNTYIKNLHHTYHYDE